MENNFAENLEELIVNYDELRKQFRYFTSNGDGNKNTLIEFEGRFNDLRADLRKYYSYFTNKWIKRDDKASTAIKFRIAVAISEGRYIDEEDETVYEECSITAAEKYASGSKRYKDFVDQRGFYKESLANITSLREEITGYINEIKDRLK